MIILERRLLKLQTEVTLYRNAYTITVELGDNDEYITKTKFIVGLVIIGGKLLKTL